MGDLYEGTSGYVGSFLTLVTKIPYFVILTRLYLTFANPNFLPLLWSIPVVAVLALLFGNLLAFHQPNFRRFWAYSSIGHMGFLLLSFSVFNSDTILVAFLYLFTYLSANIFFWAVLLQQSRRPSLDLDYREFFHKIYRLLSLNNKPLAWMTFFMLASLAGIPPTFGFASKFYFFFMLYQGGNFVLLTIVFFLNLIGLVFYLRLMRFIFFQTAPADSLETNVQFTAFSPILYGVFVVLFLLHVLFGL